MTANRKDHGEVWTQHEILEGAWYAIEQAGRLIRSANALYRAGDWSTAAAIAMFACEEVGRFRILLDLAADAKTRSVYTSDIKFSSEKDGRHQKKHQRAISAVTLNPSSQDDPLSGAMKSLTRANPQSAEYAEADRIVREAANAKLAQLPADRHSLRTRGLYVSVGDDRRWQRPRAISKIEAWYAINDATNDYASHFRRVEGNDMGYASPPLEEARKALATVRAEKNLVLELIEPEWPGALPG